MNLASEMKHATDIIRLVGDLVRERDELADKLRMAEAGWDEARRLLEAIDERIAKLEAVAEAARALTIMLDREPAEPAAPAPIRCDYDAECPGHASPNDRPCGWSRAEPAPTDEPHAACVVAAMEAVADAVGSGLGHRWRESDWQLTAGAIRSRAADWRAKGARK